MNKNVIKQWDCYKNDLENYFKITPMSSYDEYDTLLVAIINEVLNKGENSLNLDIEKITKVDDGEYQGTLLFIIPNKTYQPYIWEYWITWVGYGSCSGCDTMLGITEYGTGIPNENQVKDFMTLSLHMIQQLNSLHNIYENDI